MYLDKPENPAKRLFYVVVFHGNSGNSGKMVIS